MKKYLYGLLLVTSLLLITGCGEIPTLENGEDAVITINNKNIAVSTFYEQLKDKYGVQQLINLVDKTILDEKYPETDEEKLSINQQIEYIVNYAKENDTTFEYLINYYYGVSTEKELRDLLSLDYKRKLAVNDYVKSTITDKDIDKYYKNSIKGDISVKHILIKTNITDDMTNSEIKKEKSRALTIAKEVITKLDNNENWATLAKEYSGDDNTKEKEGSLGWINTGDTEEAFEKAVYMLKKGEYTKTPVETSYGYHIIYKIDEKDKPKLADVKEDIISTLVDEKANNDTNISNKALIELRKKAGFKIHDSELNKGYNNYIESLK